jgi:hypothetical protein
MGKRVHKKRKKGTRGHPTRNPQVIDVSSWRSTDGAFSPAVLANGKRSLKTAVRFFR